MGRPRSEFQALLDVLAAPKRAYFQPPAGMKLEYPCILYEISDMGGQYADNQLYREMTRYTVTVIDRNPDSTTRDLVASLPLCSFNRFFAADNLNHFVYNLYF